MYEVLEALQDYIKDNFNNYLPVDLPTLDIKNVIIAEPDTDKYTPKLMIHIIFDGASFEELTTNSDSATMSPEIYLIHRGYTKAELFTNLIKYSDSFIKMIRNDGSLDAVVDNCSIQNIEYFDGVFADENIKAVKITLSISYEDNY